MSQPEPVIFDSSEPSLGDQFHQAHVGHPHHKHMAARPFQGNKCAFSSKTILALAGSGRADARDFLEALLDVIEDQRRGLRPARDSLNFVCNTGTPSNEGGWLITVRMASPIVANIRMTCNRSGEWNYTIERSSQSLGRRKSPAVNAPAFEEDPGRETQRFLDL